MRCLEDIISDIENGRATLIEHDIIEDQDIPRNVLSIVVSVYNEEANLARFLEVTTGVLRNAVSQEEWDYELIFVNDGSTDQSRVILDDFAEQDEHCRVIHFSRNFGHEAAMIAGIDHAKGDFVVCMDADLQNPPELLPGMVEKFKNGSDIVLMARADNKDAGVLKKLTSGLFYGVLNFLSGVKFERNVSDFFGISKRAADVLRKDYREKNRYLRGYIQQIGFSKTVIEYVAPERFAGESKYTMKSLVRIAMNTLNCFSVTPMRVGAVAAGISLVMTVLSFAYYIGFYVMHGYGSGTALLCSMITFLFSLLFLLLGTIGEYLGMLMLELKGRPIYIVENMRNMQDKASDE